MNNKVAEMIGLMIRNKEAEGFFVNGWNALYNDIMVDPIDAMKQGENNDPLNILCGMAVLDWYESQEKRRVK